MADRLVDLLPLLGLTGESWDAWRVVAKCLDAAPLTAAEQAVYEACTNRTRPLTERPDELYVIAGRRSGKSRFAAACAQRAAGFMSYPQLAPGERAVVALAAADRDQARTVLHYVVHPFETTAALKGLLRPRSPLAKLADMVSRRTRWGLDLRTGVSIEVTTSSFRSIRGRSFAAVIADELAYWRSEDGHNPASEVSHVEEAHRRC